MSWAVVVERLGERPESREVVVDSQQSVDFRSLYTYQLSHFLQATGIRKYFKLRLRVSNLHDIRSEEDQASAPTRIPVFLTRC